VSMSNFLLDIVKHCYLTQRARYLAEDFDWMSLAVQSDCTEAQAYLAAFALPPATIVSCRSAIEARLINSTFLEKVKPMLSD
jgi:hypothetical protein